MATLRTLTWDEPDRISDVIKMEHPTYSRDLVTIAAGAGSLGIGAVLGKITAGAASSAAKSGGNTGDGTLTLDATTPVRAGAKVGVYTARCIAEVANGGAFEVKDPDGFALGQVLVGATFDNDVKFVIADGSADFIVGDGFDITIAAGSAKYKKHVNGAVDGTGTAAAVLCEAVDATSTDKTAVVVARFAEVSRLGLKWDASVDSEAKKNAAIAQLAAAGIITRAGA